MQGKGKVTGKGTAAVNPMGMMGMLREKELIYLSSFKEKELLD